MAITKSSTLANTLPTIIEEARFTEQFKSIMAGLAWNIRKELHKGSTVTVPRFGTATAVALTEGVDMASPTTMEDPKVTITPAEVGCQILITDKLERDNQEDITRAAGRILGDAMAVKRDVDLLALFDGGTTEVCGTGTTLALGHIAASHALLAGLAMASGGPAPQPYAFVQHPYVLLDIVDVLTPVAANADSSGTNTMMQSASIGMVDEVLRNYFKGRLFGINVYEDGNINVNGGGSNNAHGGVFAAGRGGAIILATAHEWEIKEDPDPSLRATELNIVGEYGVGRYLAGWVVDVLCDSTVPA